MKKYILLLCLMFCFFEGLTQRGIPTYPEVLTAFFFNYNYENTTENYLNFAKKKDGWYVQKINTGKDNELQNEIIFWSAGTSEYSNLQDSFDKQERKENGEKNIGGYLNGFGVTASWLEYDRCRYCGYKGWEEDMINDFGSIDNLSDTLLEGLARAYSNKASSYLWYMSETGENMKDTMRSKLGRIQLPSLQRVDKVIFYVNKAIETYERLEKQSPGYTTLVGNIGLKRFNEAMNGYMHMEISLQLEKAREFLAKAVLDEQYVLQAKNYLNSCDANAILFTFGDNDTYQLWYVQQKENFRKDVSVVNTSLLGLASYIQMLKKKNEVSFATPLSFIEKKISDVTYIEKPESKIYPPVTTLGELLKKIYSSSDKDPEIHTISTTQKVKLSVVPEKFNKISALKNTGPEIFFHLNSYIELNDLIELDIINENINKRPICFTSELTKYFDSNLIQHGIIYRLIPINKKSREAVTKTEITNLETFTDKIYKPVVSFISNGVKHISEDGNNCFFWQFSKVANYYSEKKDMVTAQKWLDKALKLFPLDSLNIDNMPGLYVLGQAFMNAGDKENGRRLFELYTDFLYNEYTAPSSITGYLSKSDLLIQLNYINSYLNALNINSPKVRKRIEALQD